MRQLPLAAVLAALSLHAQTYTLGPDSQPKAGVPRGTVTKYILPQGKLYPGTPHDYSVYVPAQYDAAKPTPFMIFLDGNSFLKSNVNAPVVFDNLIAAHELPPMIGIFIDPGVLPAMSANAQSRYERVFEYDSMSDRYARFLIDELIPAVSAKYNLSKNPDDRGLAGISTGAVGAFMAAWNRPDQFHRVLSFIGTYVAMKGADSLPAIVRKTEPKPLRIFMQDGNADHVTPDQPYGTFYAGSWPINNQVMYEALEYAGYDVKLVMGTEGHNMQQGGAILPDALRWLWRNYPKPIPAMLPPAMNQPGWDPRAKVYSTISPEEPWKQVGGSYEEVAGLAVDGDGNVFFSVPAESRIYKTDAFGTVIVFKGQSNGATTIRFGADGRLYAYQGLTRRIVSYGPGGDERTLAEDVDVEDIAVSVRSIVYFTDSIHRTIAMIDASGKTRTVYQGGEIALPSGMALSPDQAMLIVADELGRFSWSFQIGTDGSLINGEPFFRLEMPESGWRSGVRGVTEDSTGQVYFGTPLGVQVCEANGRMAEILNPPVPGGVSALVFGGKERNVLFVTQGGRVFRRAAKVNGNAVEAPSKPPQPPL
jgi:enterochelin esterase-like enzyme/sugar lactone lactonase YvrE